MGCRPLLSSLAETFVAIETARTAGSSTLTSSDAITREISNLAILSPLSRIRLQRPVWTKIICFGASESAGAVVYTDSTASQIDSLIAEYERCGALSRRVARDFSTDIGRPAVDIGNRVWRKNITAFVRSKKWTLAFAHTWTRREHINALEASAALMGLEWAVSHDIVGYRVLLLSDSMFVLGALTKGRSSSSRLSLYCCRLAALSLAHDFVSTFCYVSTQCNPADGPSRSRPIIRLR